jgi:hypothetical protein
MNLFEQLAQATKPPALIRQEQKHVIYIKALVKQYKSKRLTSLN